MILLKLLFAFQIKHLICDYFLQYPYMYKNKGDIGCHPGGYLHAGVHALGTLAVLGLLYSSDNPSIPTALALPISMLIDFFSHLIIDSLKVSICKVQHWEPLTSEFYWHMLGIDQFLHQCVYLFILLYIII